MPGTPIQLRFNATTLAAIDAAAKAAGVTRASWLRVVALDRLDGGDRLSPLDARRTPVRVPAKKDAGRVSVDQCPSCFGRRGMHQRGCSRQR